MSDVGEEKPEGRTVRTLTLPLGAPGTPAQPKTVPIVLDRREGARVYVRPTRRGEPAETVFVAADEVLVPYVEVWSIVLDGKPEPVRVAPAGREGNNVLVRALQPDEPDPDQPATLVLGEDELELVEYIKYAGLHLTPEVGRVDDLLTAVRLVPAGREGNKVYARTLRRGEKDTGEGVVIRDGDSLSIGAGDLRLAMDSIDEATPVSSDGYAPVARTLWTWLCVRGSDWPDGVRLVLAAARRLDASHRILMLVREALDKLDGGTLGPYATSNLSYETIGLVEITIVAMSRALLMAKRLHVDFALSAVFPSTIEQKLAAIRKIRHAYEHIDDRAFGWSHGRPDPDALSAFDFESLGRRVVRYGDHELDLGGEATQILLSAREYLKSAVAELSGRKSHAT